MTQKTLFSDDKPAKRMRCWECKELFDRSEFLDLRKRNRVCSGCRADIADQIDPDAPCPDCKQYHDGKPCGRNTPKSPRIRRLAKT